MDEKVLRQFWGSWSLISCVFRDEDGSEYYPFGKKPKGILTYQSNGIMSAQLLNSERSKFSTEDWANAPLQEIKEGFVSYQAYYGRYELDTDHQMITHHVEASLFPNWHLEGSQQVRYYNIENNLLTLTTTPILMLGTWKTFFLVWEKTWQYDEY